MESQGARAPPPPPPVFGKSVNPIQTKGADYAPHTDIINFFKHNAGHAKLY